MDVSKKEIGDCMTVVTRTVIKIYRKDLLLIESIHGERYKENEMEKLAYM